MRLLGLALRALWWRRATSVSLLLVAAFTTLIAAAGPLYASAAGDAVLQRALRVAPVGADGTGIEFISFQVGTPSTAALGRAVSDAFTGDAGRAYPTTVLQLSATVRITPVRGTDLGQLQLNNRDQFCAHVTVLAGSCTDSTDRNGFVVDADTARTLKWQVGQRVELAGKRDDGTGAATVLQLRGIVERREPGAAYWFGRAASTSADNDAPPKVWVPQAYFDSLKAEAGDNVTAAADLTLDPSAVHASNIAAVRAALDAATTRVKSTGTIQPSVSTQLNTVVGDALAGRSRLTRPIAVVVLELLVLGLYLLHTLIGIAAEARGAEIALVKLRGTRPRSTILIALLEPTLLLVLAVPVGVLGATLAVRALAPDVLGNDAQIQLGWLPWLAAALAALGGLVAAAAASVGVLRRPVLEQWRRATRRPGRRSAVFEAVVVALAVAGIVELRVSGALDGATTGGGSGVAVLAPVLLMIAGAIVASRAVAAVARLGFGVTRASGAVASFVGVRQLARRPAGRRTFGVLTVAVALVAFAVSSAVVLDHNRHDRALTDIGAPVVATIKPDPRTDARVAAVDGGRKITTAVFEASTAVSATTGVFDGTATATNSPTLLVVDPATFGTVGYWRHDFGQGSLTQLLDPLSATPPATPSVTGTRLSLDVTGASVPASLTLAVDLTDTAGKPLTARLGQLANGPRTYSADVACAGGCQIRRIYVTRPSDQIGALVTSFTVTALRMSGSVTTAPNPALDAVKWSPLNPTPALQTDPAEKVSVNPTGLRVVVAVSGRPDDTVPGFGVAAGAVSRQPALVASGAVAGDSNQVSVNSPGGGTFTISLSGQVDLVPRAGDAGIVLARDWVQAASPSGYTAFDPNEIWISAAAPADTVDRLRHAGVDVTGVQRSADLARELSRQGPAFSTALSVAGGVVAVILAAVAAVLTLALLARRRVFELSAMRALGIGTPRLVASVVLEQGTLVVAATISGLLLGLGAVALALPALPAYVDQPAYPTFVVDQPLALTTGVAAVVAAALVLTVLLSATVLVHSAAPSRLREAEG